MADLTVPIPDEMLDLLAEPAVGRAAYTTAAGQIVPFPMWVGYDGEHLLVSSPAGSK